MEKAENTVEVLIDGKIYTLTGGDPFYIQKVSGYVNSKIAQIKTSKSYRGLDSDYKKLFLNLNIADDYFKAMDENEDLKKKLDEAEKELYSVKHDLVSTKLKLENSLKQQALLENRLSAANEEDKK